MNDYINRADALEACHPVMPTDGVWTIGLTYEDIKNIPAADVVEVVRCKDCKYFERDHRLDNETITSIRGFCKVDNTDFVLRPLDDYCSDAVLTESEKKAIVLEYLQDAGLIVTRGA